MAAVSVKQIKAARALLDWSQSELGARSGLTQTAITNIESGRHQPGENTLSDIVAAFQMAGIEFIDGGVRERPDGLHIIQGDHFKDAIMDHVFETMVSENTKEMMINGVDFKLLNKQEKANIAHHVKRLQSAGMRQRILVPEGTDEAEIIGPKEWHRAISLDLFSNLTPAFIYHYNYAVMLFERQQVIVIHNANLAEHQTRHFNWLWDKAKTFA